MIVTTLANAYASALANAPARCAGCAIKIPLRRRLAVPGCRRCADCQEMVEQLQRKQIIKRWSSSCNVN